MTQGTPVMTGAHHSPVRVPTRPAARPVLRKPCDADPDLWFSTEPADQFEAAQACSFCPLLDACEQFGADEIYGVWGGRLRGYTKTRRQPVTKACAYEPCGESFVTATASAKYCSPKCRDLAFDARRRAAYAAQKRCALEGCRNRFTPKMRSQRFCSRACGNKSKREAAKRAAELLRTSPRLRELLEDTQPPS